MADVLFVGLLFAFFALAVVFVRTCERIIGPDLETRASAGGTVARTLPEPDRDAA